MKTLGVYLAKSQFRYSVLESPKDHPKLVAKERLITTDPDDVPALMDWFDTQFRMILDRFQPDRIGYRLTLEPKKAQLFTSEFPLGILNLLAYQRNIPIEAYSPQTYVGSKLLLGKSADVFAHCDHVFGDNPPYWDKAQKSSLLAAWFELE